MPFSYTPSPRAVRGTINGTPVALDIQGPVQVGLSVMAQNTDGSWDYVGPTKSQGRLWSLFDQNSPLASGQSYKHADGTVNSNATITAMVNKYDYALVDDWIPKANQLLAAQFPSSGPGPQPGQITNDTDARQRLATRLDAFKIVGNQIVLK